MLTFTQHSLLLACRSRLLRLRSFICFYCLPSHNAYAMCLIILVRNTLIVCSLWVVATLIPLVTITMLNIFVCAFHIAKNLVCISPNLNWLRFGELQTKFFTIWKTQKNMLRNVMVTSGINVATTWRLQTISVFLT